MRKGNEIVDLMVTQHKGPWHAINGDAGYGTGQGIKAASRAIPGATCSRPKAR